MIVTAACYVAAAFGEEEEGVGGQGRVVDDLTALDHFLELPAWHPLVPESVLLRLEICFARRQLCGEKINAVLRRHPVARGQRAQVGHPARAQARLLREFQPGEFLRRAGRSVREAALRERPAAPADRIAVLLDEVEATAFGGNDQGEVASFYDGVGAP